MKNRYFIEIRKRAERYEGSVHRGDPEKGQPLPAALDLGPEVEPFPGQGYTLGSLLAHLIAFEADFIERRFDERLQLDLGRYLYDQTLGQLEHEEPPVEAAVEVRIVTDDEHVARLPWVLLARGGRFARFLCASGWSVALSRPRKRYDDCRLPRSPRMLIVVPQPAGVETQAEAHLEELELLLSSADHHFKRGRNLQVATTWEEFHRLISEFQPHLVYYYGHGEGDDRTSRLVFPAGRSGKRRSVPIADVAQSLRQAAGKPPLLAYLNCCQGDAGGLLGAGWQLGDLVPAVVTNRTAAGVNAAQSQATYFWRAVLLDGTPPHQAVAEIYGHLGDMGLTFRDARWMTPVLHCHYDRWESPPARPRHRIADPHWHVKIDRIGQFGEVFLQTDTMLRNRKPTCLAYLWYGQEGQGIEQFHQRLKVDLRERLGSVHLHEVRPRWPEELADPHRSFEEIMLEAFEVASLDYVPAAIRSETRGETGRDVVVYARHEPVRHGEVFQPRHLRSYLAWWDEVFAPLLREAPAFGLLGISFVVGNPTGFLETLAKQKVEALELEAVVFRILDEMERLAKKDLLDFLHTYDVPVPATHRDRVLNQILKQTGGHYEMTLEALRDLVYRAWDRTAEEEGVEEVGEDEDNW